MNKCDFIGRVASEPQMRTVGDSQVCSFRLAVDSRQKEQTIFITCEAWGKLAEMITMYCPKGKQVGISARLKQRSYEKDGKKNTVNEFAIESLDLLGAKNENL